MLITKAVIWVKNSESSSSKSNGTSLTKLRSKSSKLVVKGSKVEPTMKMHASYKYYYFIVIRVGEQALTMCWIVLPLCYNWGAEAGVYILLCFLKVLWLQNNIGKQKFVEVEFYALCTFVRYILLSSVYFVNQKQHHLKAFDVVQMFQYTFNAKRSIFEVRCWG